MLHGAQAGKLYKYDIHSIREEDLYDSDHSDDEVSVVS